MNAGYKARLTCDLIVIVLYVNDIVSFSTHSLTGVEKNQETKNSSEKKVNSFS